MRPPAPPPIDGAGGALSSPPAGPSGRPFDGATTCITFSTRPSVALPRASRRAGRRAHAPLAASLTLTDAPARVLDALDRVRRRVDGAAPVRGRKHRPPPPPPPPFALTLPPAAARAARYARHLAAGAASCAVTRTVLAPLERVKLEQVLRARPGAAPAAAARGFRATVAALYTQGGLAAFWQGNGVNLLRTCPHKAVNFFAFDTYRRALLARPGRAAAAANNDFGNGERFLAGALAGMTATALCFPLDVLRTRIMAGGGPRAAGGVRAAARALVAAEGVRGLYVGLAPALVATAPSGAIFYGTYDVVKEAYLRAVAARGGARPARLGPRETLAFGALAGAAAELAIYPAEVVRRRMQLDAAAAAAAAARAGGAAAAVLAPRPTFARAAAALVRERGVAGLYAGLGANMLQVLPSAALSYYAYEVFKSVLRVDEEEVAG